MCLTISQAFVIAASIQRVNKRCIVESLCVIMELGMTCKEVENSKLNINPIIVPGGILDTKGFC